MNKHCEKTTAHSRNILHGDIVYNINRNKYNTFCAALAFVKVTCDRMVMIVYRICIFSFICYAVGLLQYSKSVWSKVGAPTVYILISSISMHQNCVRSGKGCKMYPIFTMFPFSTFPNKITLYICWECQAYAIKIMLYYLVLQSFT